MPRTVVWTLVACLIAFACDGPTAPTQITSTEMMQGNVMWVDPVGRRFVAWGFGSFDVSVAPFTSVSGKGIRNFDDLTNLYREGKKLYVKTAVYSDPFIARSVEVTDISGPFPITFHKHLYSLSLPAGLWSGIYHDKFAFILPWTKFRSDADYTSFEAVKAALLAKDQPLCMAGEGYDVHYYAIHTTTIGVWRAKDARDTCEGR